VIHDDNFGLWIDASPTFLDCIFIALRGYVRTSVDPKREQGTGNREKWGASHFGNTILQSNDISMVSAL